MEELLSNKEYDGLASFCELEELQVRAVKISYLTVDVSPFICRVKVELVPRCIPCY